MTDIDELVERLREHPENDRPGGAVCQDAADALERQQRDLKEAVGLLLLADEIERTITADEWYEKSRAFLARVKI